MSVRPSVRPSVCPSGTYNLSNRNRYKKSVITKKLRIDKNRCNEKKIKKNIFSAYGKLLAEKHVFLKSKPLKMWNFGRNEKVSSWCDDFKKQEKSQNTLYFGLEKIISRKTRFFLNQNCWRYDAFSCFLKSTLYSFTIMSILMYS